MLECPTCQNQVGAGICKPQWFRILFVSMSDLTTYVHPAYENVLCSFVTVTLAEFVAHLDDVGSIIVLMERLSLIFNVEAKPSL
jgi:hypothetical protein